MSLRTITRMPMTLYRLDENTRSDICFFAFLIGNGTLCYSAVDAPEFDYDHLLDHPNALLGHLVAIYCNSYVRQQDDSDSYDPDTRAASHLASLIIPNYQLAPPLGSGELDITLAPIPAFVAITTFAHQLGQGQLQPTILKNINYYEELVSGGSFLQQIFAIFTNVLQCNQDQQPLNAEYAQQRAAQYIRSYCDATYKVVPPFEDWEVELL